MLRQRLRVLHGEVQRPDRRTGYLPADDRAGRHQHAWNVLVLLDLAVREAETRSLTWNASVGSAVSSSSPPAISLFLTLMFACVPVWSNRKYC